MNTRPLRTVGMLAVGAVAGGILAGTVAAHAADTSSAAPATSYSAQAAQGGGGQTAGGGNQGASGETALTGTELSQAKSAALKAVPGGTVVRAETDSGDATYEVHMTTSDGGQVTVKLDKAMTVTAVEDGMGE